MDSDPLLSRDREKRMRRQPSQKLKSFSIDRQKFECKSKMRLFLRHGIAAVIVAIIPITTGFVPTVQLKPPRLRNVALQESVAKENPGRAKFVLDLPNISLKKSPPATRAPEPSTTFTRRDTLIVERNIVPEEINAKDRLQLNSLHSVGATLPPLSTRVGPPAAPRVSC